MPTNRRPLMRYRGAVEFAELDPWREFALLYPRRGGGAVAVLFGPDWETVIPALWEAHGQRLTAAWIVDSLGRGSGISRPALWYAFDGPGEERRVINRPSPSVEARWRSEHTWFGVMVGAS